MRLVTLENCRSGMKTERGIYMDNGVALIEPGTELTESMIKELGKKRVHRLYVEDRSTEDVVFKEDLPLEVRTAALASIRETFYDLTKKEQNWERLVNEVDTSRLTGVFKNMLSGLESSDNVINLLSNIHFYDDYVLSHSMNVTVYTIAMGLKFNLSEYELQQLAIGGMLHDIGKAFIPLDILNKTGKLTSEEMALVQTHTDMGYDILKRHQDISPLTAYCALEHHEKLDGTGYPRQLRGNEIHLYGRIMAVADVFDALTSHRSYRKAMLPDKAMNIIYAGKGTHFDPVCVEAFERSVATYPIGMTVTLNTGETGIVTKYQFDEPRQPVVRLLRNPYGETLRHPEEINLAADVSRYITDSDALL